MSLEVSLAPDLAGRVRLGILVLDGVAVRDGDAGLSAEVDTYSNELRSRYATRKSAEVPGAAEARGLYKALGLDPTKTRPSSEALLRRVLKGEALYQVNSLVDTVNLCSLRYQLPFGLYDVERIEPPVVLRRGAPGESYEGIRKALVSVDGRPVLADGQGPFGNPTSDSARTMITLQTRSALVAVYAPVVYSAARLAEVLDGTELALKGYCGGTRRERLILAGAG